MSYCSYNTSKCVSEALRVIIDVLLFNCSTIKCITQHFLLFQKLFQINVHDVCHVLYYYTFLIVILSCDTVSDRAMHFDVLQLVCDDEQDKKKN